MGDRPETDIKLAVLARIDAAIATIGRIPEDLAELRARLAKEVDGQIASQQMVGFSLVGESGPEVPIPDDGTWIRFARFSLDQRSTPFLPRTANSGYIIDEVLWRARCYDILEPIWKSAASLEERPVVQSADQPAPSPEGNTKPCGHWSCLPGWPCRPCRARAEWVDPGCCPDCHAGTPGDCWCTPTPSPGDAVAREIACLVNRGERCRHEPCDRPEALEMLKDEYRLFRDLGDGFSSYELTTRQLERFASRIWMTAYARGLAARDRGERSPRPVTDGFEQYREAMAKAAPSPVSPEVACKVCETRFKDERLEGATSFKCGNCEAWNDWPTPPAPTSR